jgi:DNA repair exonuclease SbcCD ATPase subunit
VSTDTTKAMEEALQAAVARMTKSEGGGAGAGTDPMGLLMSLLPRLLASNEEREDLVEKLEGLEKESFAPLQEQIRGLRKQVHRVSKMQEELLEELRELREQQTAVGSAVLHLAEQMARVQIVDDVPDDGYDDPYDDVLLRRKPSDVVGETGRIKSAGDPSQRRKRPRPRRPE